MARHGFFSLKIMLKHSHAHLLSKFSRLRGIISRNYKSKLLASIATCDTVRKYVGCNISDLFEDTVTLGVTKCIIINLEKVNVCDIKVLRLGSRLGHQALKMLMEITVIEKSC